MTRERQRMECIIMKFALVEGRRVEAQRKLSGECPSCGSAMVAKCGERRVRHWAHHGTRQCDPWWENETEWHRGWKNNFPIDWQEVIHRAENGERHIADVKTTHGRVIEFQHSYLDPKERRDREGFYGSIVWVVNGLRRARDKPNFYKCLDEGRIIGLRPLTYSVPNRCGLLLEWSESNVGVYFDFGTAKEDMLFGNRVLWRLSPKSPDGTSLLRPVLVTSFIEALTNGERISGIAIKEVRPTTRRILNVPRLPPRPPRGPMSWLEYQAWQHRKRSKARF